jgi:hypothetical protein
LCQPTQNMSDDKNWSSSICVVQDKIRLVQQNFFYKICVLCKHAIKNIKKH